MIVKKIKKKIKKHRIKGTKLLSRVFLISILLIPGILLASLFITKNVEAAWFDTGWGFRQKMPVNNTSGSTQVDFQIDVTINTATLVTNGKLQSNCQDIRFTDQSGKVLPYWIEPTTCNTTTTKIWIKVPTIHTSGTDIFYYYGNPSASNPNYKTTDVFLKDIPGPVASWPLDDTTTTQSYSRVVNPAVSTGRELLIDGNMETAGISSWGTIASAILSKEITNPYAGSQVLRVTRNGQENPMATQSILSAGRAYRITGVARSDGNTGNIPRIYLTSSWTIVWSGTTSTSWQSFDVTFVATNPTVALTSFTNTGSNYSEFDNVSIVQVNIPPSSGTATQLATDGNAETSGTSAWTAINSATLSKQSATRLGGTGTQVLRVARNGVSTPLARQTILTVGQVYRVNGYVRSDGSATPKVYTNGTTTTLFTGTTSTAWQPFDAVFMAAATDISFGSNTNTGTKYVEFDDVTVSLDTHVRTGELLLDGNMETSGTATWIPGSHVILSKETGAPHGGSQVIRLTTVAGGNAVGGQLILTLGKTYRATGYARSDSASSTTPGIYLTAGGAIWIGTTSASWQPFDFTFKPGSSIFYLFGAGSQYVEFDDVSVTEVDPLVGIPTNGVVLGSSSGAGGHLTNAYTFDGTNDNVNIYSSDLNSVFNPDEGTLVAWAKVSSGAIWSNTVRRIATLTVDANNKISIYKTATANQLRVDYIAGGTTKSVTDVSLAGTTNWFQLGISWSKSGDMVKAYINGAQVGSTQTGLGTWVGNIAATTAAIGAAGSAGTTEPWSGLINDVKLYTRALSAEEIASQYSASTDLQGYISPTNLSNELIRKYNTLVSVGSAGSEEIGSSPIAYWSFDEGQGITANDKSTNRYVGTLTSMASSPTAASGWQTEDQCVSGKCLSFDGSDDKVTTNLNMSTKFPVGAKITFSFWLRKNGRASSGQNIIAGDPGGGPDISAHIGYTDANKISVRLYGGAAATSDVAVSDGKWHQIVWGTDGSSTFFYVDGNPQTTSPAIGSFSRETSLWLGARNGSGLFTGQLDEVKIYSYARTAAQIKSDYLVGATKIGSSIVVGAKQPFLSNGLVGYWKMDEASWNGTAGEVKDASGNGNNGVSVGGSTTSTGKFGSGGNFDGSNDQIEVPTIANDMPSNSWTQAYWIKTSTNSNLIISEKGTNVAFLQTMPGGNIRIGITQISTLDTSLSNGINDNSWHHVVGVYDYNAGSLSTYIDGVKRASRSNAGVSGSNSTPFTIAGRYHSTSAPFNGSIDEARIYNRALSADEVRSLYQFAPGPVGYWNFEEGTGSVVNDVSGYGNVGTWNGTLGNQWISGKIGKAGNFNGIDNYVNVPYNNSLKLADNGSISLWFKPTTLSAGTHNVISYGGVSYASGYLINQIGSGLNIYWLSLSPSIDLSASTIFTRSTWYHIELVNNNGGLSIYVNGILRGTGNSGGSINSNLATKIGADTANWFTNGQIDDVKIYNYARTPEQVLQDMHGGVLGDSGARLPYPIAHYSFDEQQGQTANNKGTLGSTANGTFGASTAVSTDDPTWKTKSDCKVNGCVSFDSGDYVNLGNNSAFDSSNISVSSWVNFSSLAANQYILGKEISSTPYGGWMMRINNNGKLDFSVSVGATNYLNEYSVANMATGTWYHILGTYDGETINLYLDGKLVATNTNPSGNIVTNAANVNIGRSEGFGRNISGKIDEVKIYNVALTPEQVRQDMNAGAQVNFGSTAASEASLGVDGAGNPPIAYWDFEEHTGNTANDKSGNGNTGTLTNGPAWSQGKYGSALRFDGTNDYVSLGTGLNSTFVVPFSISVWVKPETFSPSFSQIPIFGGYYLNLSTKNYLSLEKNTGKVWLDQWPPSDNGLKSTSAIPLNTWSHIEAVQTSTSRSIYINGVLNVTDSSPETFSGTAPTDWQIGGWSGANYYFKGSIDEVKLYNYARTPAQVAYDYNRGAPLAWWKMDECEGSSIHDSSGNNLHGTWSGAAGTQTSVGTCNTISTAWGNGATGKFNASLNFDGTDDYVQITDTNDIAHQTGDLSFGGWFKTTDGGGANGRVLLNKGSSHNWLYSTAIVNGQIYCKLFVANNADDYLLTISPLTYNDGIWHHSMCVVSGNTISNYIDGKLVATDNTTSGTRDVSSTGHLYIGAFHYNAQMIFFWNGQLDDIRVYNYGLSSNQIKQLYNGGAAILFGN